MGWSDVHGLHDTTMELRACGKLILLGEHAVVYNRPAIAIGLPDGLVVERIKASEGSIRIRVPDWGLDAGLDSEGLIGKSLRRLMEAVPGGEMGCELACRSKLPVGAGLGSSAALAVLVVKALASVRGVVLADSEVRELAHESEKIFHAHPSGLDDTAATFGGLLLFKRKGWMEPTDRAIDRLEKLTKQARRIPYAPPPLVVGHSGVSHSTRKMVQNIREQWEADQKRVEALFDEIEGCVDEGFSALADGDRPRLGRAMQSNQFLLSELGLSCPEIDRMVLLAEEEGALGAKLTGAGGGGCVAALAPGREERLIEGWRAHGFAAWPAPTLDPVE